MRHGAGGSGPRIAAPRNKGTASALTDRVSSPEINNSLATGQLEDIFLIAPGRRRNLLPPRRERFPPRPDKRLVRNRSACPTEYPSQVTAERRLSSDAQMPISHSIALLAVRQPNIVDDNLRTRRGRQSRGDDSKGRCDMGTRAPNRGSCGAGRRDETPSSTKRHAAYLAKASGLTWKQAARNSGYANENVARGEARNHADRRGLPWPPQAHPVPEWARRVSRAFPPKPAPRSRPPRR